MLPFSNILLFGNFSPPLLAFSRSCFNLGINTHLIEVGDGDRFFKRYSSCLSSQHFFSNSDLFTPSGIKKINEVASKVKATAVIAVSESILLWLSKSSKEGALDIELLSSNFDTLNKLKSKQAQLSIASKVGFNILPTWSINHINDYTNIPETEYPICIRPSIPEHIVPTFKAIVIKTPTELVQFLQSINRINSEILAQPFKSCPTLNVQIVRSLKGEIIAAWAFTATRMFEGVTLSLQNLHIPQSIIDNCINFTHESNIVGPCEFELLYDKPHAYYLEVNIRMGGVTDKVKKFGFDLPSYIVSTFSNMQSHKVFDDYHKDAIVVTKKALIKHIKRSLFNKTDDLDYPKQSKFKHIYQSFSEIILAKDAAFDSKDLRGYFWYYLQNQK